MSVEAVSQSASLSSSSSSSPSQLSPLPKVTGSLGVHGESSIFSKRETAGRLQEMQSYLMTLDEVDIEEDEQANELFTRHTIDTVYASYAAVRNQVTIRISWSSHDTRPSYACHPSHPLSIRVARYMSVSCVPYVTRPSHAFHPLPIRLICAVRYLSVIRLCYVLSVIRPLSVSRPLLDRVTRPSSAHPSLIRHPSVARNIRGPIILPSLSSRIRRILSYPVPSVVRPYW
ncbi:hypothetical protein DFH29DRAFT_1008803 [Suillus ampliporus]|nr:hypothetical protein DFH29DRAFT_1008803 [Suillus ampliporus]